MKTFLKLNTKVPLHGIHSDVSKIKVYCGTLSVMPPDGRPPDASPADGRPPEGIHPSSLDFYPDTECVQAGFSCNHGNSYSVNTRQVNAENNFDKLMDLKTNFEQL